MNTSRRASTLHSPSFLATLALVAIALPSAPSAQVGSVLSEQKISQTTGGFGGTLGPAGGFTESMGAVGDLDGDGNVDLAVGQPDDPDGGAAQGALWIVFLNADGSVKGQQKISETNGGFGGVLDPNDRFGKSAAGLGDLDGDGVLDLAVGAYQDTDTGTVKGAVWILFLNANGTVKTQQKINELNGGFGGDLDTTDYFGYSVAGLGDLDDDGVEDLAVGAVLDGKGAVWILRLNSNGTVKAEQKISQTDGGFGGTINGNEFASSLAGIGDLDGDGVEDLAVGQDGASDGGFQRGAVWILFLNADGTVSSEQKISQTSGGFGGMLSGGGLFGCSVCALDDLDGDGIEDLGVGQLLGNDGDTAQGAAWVLFLNTDGTVLDEQKISATQGSFGGDLDANDNFGRSVAALGDLDGDGNVDMAVGARNDDDGGSNLGAAWILFLAPENIAPTPLCPPLVWAIDGKVGPPGEVVFFSVPATDDHDPAPTVLCVPPSGSTFPFGTTIVTCTATDAAGNQGVCMFPVTVVPTVWPRSQL